MTSASTMVSFAASCSIHPLPFPAAAKASLPRSRRRPLFCFSQSIALSGRTAPVACSVAVNRRRCECFDLHQQLVPFVESWAWQQSIVTRRKGLVDQEDHSDTIIALQHPPVYTMGTASTEDDLHFNVKDAPFEIHRIDRGGKVTYHGPGQLVIYPILNLGHPKMDHHRHQYIRLLEEVIIRAVQSAFSIKASRIEGLTGVWVGDQKIAAIGIRRLLGQITYHGLALNVTTDLNPFQLIVPCGIKDRGVGSIKEILQKASNGREIDEAVMMDIAYNSLIKEFAEVFQLSLDLMPDCIQPV